METNKHNWGLWFRIFLPVAGALLLLGDAYSFFNQGRCLFRNAWIVLTYAYTPADFLVPLAEIGGIDWREAVHCRFTPKYHGRHEVRIIIKQNIGFGKSIKTNVLFACEYRINGRKVRSVMTKTDRFFCFSEKEARAGIDNFDIPVDMPFADEIDLSVRLMVDPSFPFSDELKAARLVVKKDSDK